MCVFSNTCESFEIVLQYLNLTKAYTIADVCDIYRNATVSADIGNFEGYCDGIYATRPDHIRLKINCPGTICIGPDSTLLKITLILLDIIQNYPYIAGYRCKFADIVQYRLKKGPI